MADLHRIQTVSVVGPTTLEVQWRGGGSDRIDLAGWIRSDIALLGSLLDPVLFAQPTIIAHSTAIAWGDPDGDLAIDAHHLVLMATGQLSYGPEQPAIRRAAG